MSIRDLINYKVQAGLLRRLELRLDDPVVRCMLLSRELQARLDGPWDGEPTENDRLGRRFGRLRADLEDFVAGGRISMSLEPYNARDAFMGLLFPPGDGIFDIRSADPKPGIRVLGGFAETDVFVALTCTFRKSLKDRRSREWRDEIQACQGEWRRLLDPFSPLTGTDVHQFVSTNVFAV